MIQRVTHQPILMAVVECMKDFFFFLTNSTLSRVNLSYPRSSIIPAHEQLDCVILIMDRKSDGIVLDFSRKDRIGKAGK